MGSRFRIACVLIVSIVSAGPAWAHFHMFFPQTSSARRGEAVTFVYQWGHPFEHQLFDTARPERVAVIAPDGGKSELIEHLEKANTGYRLRWTPEQRGDHVLVAQAPAVFMEEDGEFLQDMAKVVLHVQAQKGWDASAGLVFEMLPLTRPYGLQPGMVFQAQVLAGGKPCPGSMIEIERYNAEPPKQLPAEEHITRSARTDPNGVVTCTLTEPGWWCLTARRDAGKKDHAGKSYPVRQRTTLWVHVDRVP